MDDVLPPLPPIWDIVRGSFEFMLELILVFAKIFLVCFIFVAVFLLVIAAIFIVIAGLLVGGCYFVEVSSKVYNWVSEWLRSITCSILTTAEVSIHQSRKNWTIAPLRLSWRSYQVLSDSRTPLLSDPVLSGEDVFFTSRLCKECLRIVQDSSLISGSRVPLVRRVEWHECTFHFQGVKSSGTCHMCRIMWFSIPTYRRIAIVSNAERASGTRNTWHKIKLNLSITKEAEAGWFARGQLFLQAFHEKDRQLKELCERIPIVEVLASESTGSTQCSTLARNWISNCRRGHEACRRSGTSSSPQGYLPRRLLYVGDQLSSALRLVETSDRSSLPAHPAYLTLSYKADKGESGLSQSLTSENKGAWQDHIDDTKLPLTIQHAIQLSRRLGIGCLWIDTMCVYQDDAGDIEQNSSNLANIYAHSVCNIVGGSAGSGDRGLFSSRPPGFLQFPCYIRFSSDKALKLVVAEDTYAHMSFKQAVDDNELSKDSAFFVERLISPRLLHFNKGSLFFECETHVASEFVPNVEFYRESRPGLLLSASRMWRTRCTNLLKPASFSVFNPVDGYRASVNALQSMTTDTPSSEQQLLLHNHWMNLAEAFWRLNATSPEKRHASITQLARHIAGTNTSLNFAYGMWRRHIIFDLMWYVGSNITQRPVPKRAPTWSWLSVETDVSKPCNAPSETEIEKSCKFSIMATLENDNIFRARGDEQRPDDAEFLAIRCRMLRGAIKSPTEAPRKQITLDTRQGDYDAVFLPDLSDLGEKREVFCAELGRWTAHDNSNRKHSFGACSAGLVLHRTLVRTSSGVTTTYERIGVFYLHWLMATSTNGEVSNIRGHAVFDKSNWQTIRVV
ncbi:hypothetical protein BU23DRAFT_603488 [Bimuria novae-zelandiae CBS 107.79]|uniref:Heterokaryon incompatibility domain-containing protein n=1 Tax=Bimuria novae-zelandiae CBS 107.79 TaxID=1447943 RepID=A0A6A5UMX1_9PLEO|nr:hypothetical protein BU23DRAFT_603488 [Bimuria novae-zelandiae CBS 107.79]